mgnify:CR=1 FL=1
MNAEIITIGTEILIGQIIDTNSAWIGEKLNEIGVDVQQITSIKDVKSEIEETVSNALIKNDIVLVTGGLGPTNDDITKKTLAELFGGNLIQNDDCLDNVKESFKRFDRPLQQVNIDQALVPDNCTAIVNKAGTAPCMWFNRDGKIVVSMPGVPFEMKWLMNNEILPRLKEEFHLPVIEHRTILTSGEGESMIAERLVDFEASLPSNMSLAYLPSAARVRLRITVKGQDKAEVIEQIEAKKQELSNLVSDVQYGEERMTMAESLAKELIEREMFVAVAESCTGGNMAAKIVSTPGSSNYFKGSMVTYWEEIKSQLINVSPETIEKHTVVSEEVASEMAIGVKNALGVDCAISTTGVAGPDGGTEENPVGKVCIGTVVKDQVKTQTYYFAGTRDKIIERACITGLNQLRKQLICG